MRSNLLMIGLAAACLLRGAEISVVDEIIAKVNGDIITRNDYERTRKQMEATLRQQQGLSGVRLNQELEQAEKNILRERIDQLLLISRAKELNISVDGDVN